MRLPKIHGLMKERKECKKCRWFSEHLAWWDWLRVPPELKEQIIGRCYRPRNNYSDYAIVKAQNPKKCPFYEPKEASE